MNSRERLKLVLKHEEADRVPIDFGGFRDSCIAAIAYNKLKKELGVNKHPARMYDFIMQLAYPEQEILDLFNVDTIDAGRGFLGSEDNWREWVLNDSSKCIIPKYLNVEVDNESTVLLKNSDDMVLGKKPENSLYVDYAYHVYGDLEKIPSRINKEDLDKEMWAIPTPEWSMDIFDKNGYKKFKDNIRELYEKTERAIVLHVGCSLFAGMSLRGLENFLCDLLLDKKGVIRLFDTLVEKYLLTLDLVLKGVGRYVDVLVFGDDLGGQNGPIIPPKVFRELFRPYYKKMYDFVHDNSNCKVMLHSCGSVYEFIPDLIDIGLDILNPVQTNTKDMDPKRLKKEFGRYITFWGGGCETKILTFGTPEEIKKDVKIRIEIFSEGGGFVFTQIHNILANVPPKNIIAMFGAAKEYGIY